MKLRAKGGRHAEPAGVWPDNVADGECDPDLRSKVRECIDRLPQAYRTILILRGVEEFDTEQTAAILNLTPANVKVRLHRARLALCALLRPLFECPGRSSAAA